jgi:carboxyl-terminal processing protease
VSGALQDYKRAVIVGGDHTFGKGSVQSVLPIPGQLGAIKVTVGMFFIPGGNSTQHRGVSADVTLPGPYSNDEIGEKSLDYSLPPKKVDPFISKEAYVTEGEGAWKEIKEEWIKSLKEQSQARVDKNADFKKIIEELKKVKEKGKTIKVSDVLKDKDKNEKEKKKSKKKQMKKKNC